MPIGLTSFEADLLSSLATGDPEEAALRDQIANAHVVSRKHTGVGLYVNFEVSTDATRLRTTNRYIDETPKTHIEHPDLEAGAGSLLWFKDGWLATLECYTYGVTNGLRTSRDFRFNRVKSPNHAQRFAMTSTLPLRATGGLIPPSLILFSLGFMQIFLTALVTILGGAVTLALGQILVRGALEPAIELKRLIGTIASDLDFYANRFAPGTPDEQAWRDIFRKHSCSLREKLNVIVWYRFFETIFHLPPEGDVLLAAAQLTGHSNRPASVSMAGELASREPQIKKLLRIKT